MERVDPPWWKFWRAKPLRPWMTRMTPGLVDADIKELQVEQLQAQHQYAHVQALAAVASVAVAFVALVVAVLALLK